MKQLTSQQLLNELSKLPPEKPISIHMQDDASGYATSSLLVVVEEADRIILQTYLEEYVESEDT